MRLELGKRESFSKIDAYMEKKYFYSSIEDFRRINTKRASLVELTPDGDKIPANRKYNEVGNNTEGDKYFALVDVLRKGRRRRVGRMFVKVLNADFVYADFFPEYGEIPMLEKYEWLKKRGFPVVPTLRINRETSEVLMTDVTDNGRNVLIDKQNTLLKSGIRLSNVEALKNEAVKVSERAFKEGLLLNIDAFSVVVTPDGIGRLMLIDIGTRTYFVTEKMKSERDGYENGENGRRESIEKFVNGVLAY